MTRWLLRGGSMKPFFWPGDLLLVEEVDADQVRWGHVVVFLSNSKPSRHVAHRVLSARWVGGKRVIVTRGDNVSVVDPPVGENAILGRVTGRWRHGRVVRVSRTEEAFAWVLSRGGAWTRRQHPWVYRVVRKMGATVMNRLKPREGIVFRQEGEDGMLFVPETGEVKLLNESGVLIWQMLEANQDRDAILARMSETYEGADPGSLMADLDEFLENIRRSKLVEDPEPAGV